jgi:hypothetical protein
LLFSIVPLFVFSRIAIVEDITNRVFLRLSLGLLLPLWIV